jgi:hypothetical protein
MLHILRAMPLRLIQQQPIVVDAASARTHAHDPAGWPVLDRNPMELLIYVFSAETPVPQGFAVVSVSCGFRARFLTINGLCGKRTRRRRY